MKSRLKLVGIGAAVGAALLLLFWLLGDVAHVLGLNLQDSSFFLGLVLSLIGLLMVVRGGPGAKYSVFTTGKNLNGATVQDIAMEKDSSKVHKEAQEERKAPFICLGAGLLNILICAITFLF